MSMPLTNFTLIICRFHLASFIPIVTISRASQLLHDIQLWMHSWGFSFQLNASRNKISENGFTLADSVLKVFPKRFYRENITGFKPQALSSGLQFEFGFHFSYLQQRKNPSKVIVFSKKGPDLWNALALLSKGISRYSKNLLFLPDQLKAAKPLFIFWFKVFLLMETFTHLPQRVVWRWVSSVILWNFAYAKYAFYFLPRIPSEAAKQVSNKFLKAQHHSLSLLLEV